MSSLNQSMMRLYGQAQESDGSAAPRRDELKSSSANDVREGISELQTPMAGKRSGNATRCAVGDATQGLGHVASGRVFTNEAGVYERVRASEAVWRRWLRSESVAFRSGRARPSPMLLRVSRRRSTHCHAAARVSHVALDIHWCLSRMVAAVQAPKRPGCHPNV